MGLPQTLYRFDLQPADLATVDELARKPDRRAETVGVANYRCGTTSFESGDHLIAIVKPILEVPALQTTTTSRLSESVAFFNA